MEQLIRTREEQLLADYMERLSGINQLQDRVNELAAICCEEGYMVKVEVK